MRIVSKMTNIKIIQSRMGVITVNNILQVITLTGFIKHKLFEK